MKAKLLRRIRKQYYIGITKNDTYVWANKSNGFDCYEWIKDYRCKFYENILRGIGLRWYIVDRLINANFNKKYNNERNQTQPKIHQELLNKISR